MEFDWGAVWHYAPYLLIGAWISLQISALSIAVGTIFGLALAFLRLSRNRVLRGTAWTYIWLIRGTPLLLQIFFIYYALPVVGIRLSPFASGVITLGLSSAAYYAEIFRAVIGSIHHGQMEAALALGLTRVKAYRKVILPQVVRPATPPFIGQSITLVKESALVSVISVPDLMLTSESIYASTYKVFEILGLTGVLYLALTSLLQIVQTVVERRLRYGATGS